MCHLTSNHQLCHFTFLQLLTSCWTSPPSLTFMYFSNWAISCLTVIKASHLSFNGSYISTPSPFSPTSSTCVSLHSVPLLPCSNNSSFFLWNIAELEAGGTKMSYSPSFPLTNLQIIWRCVTVCNLSISATLATDLYVSKRIHAMPLALSNDPIRHVYV